MTELTLNNLTDEFITDSLGMKFEQQSRDDQHIFHEKVYFGSFTLNGLEVSISNRPEEDKPFAVDVEGRQYKTYKNLSGVKTYLKKVLDHK